MSVFFVLLYCIVAVVTVQCIEATSAVGSGQVIGEYTGSVMLRQEYEQNEQFEMYVVHVDVDFIVSVMCICFPNCLLYYINCCLCVILTAVRSAIKILLQRPLSKPFGKPFDGNRPNLELLYKYRPVKQYLRAVVVVDSAVKMKTAVITSAKLVTKTWHLSVCLSVSFLVC